MANAYEGKNIDPNRSGGDRYRTRRQPSQSACRLTVVSIAA
jgi:hypothetical protein